MRFMVLAAVFIFGECAAREAISEEKVMECVSAFSHCGVLKRSNGFLYVDLDDAYIHQIVPLLQEEGFSTPPYFGRPELVGAHISVAYPEDMDTLGDVEELGSIISFTPKRTEIIRLTKPTVMLPNVEELYLIIVESPLLDAIKEKYCLPKKLYPFHITVGVK